MQLLIAEKGRASKWERFKQKDYFFFKVEIIFSKEIILSLGNQGMLAYFKMWETLGKIVMSDYVLSLAFKELAKVFFVSFPIKSKILQRSEKCVNHYLLLSAPNGEQDN